MVFASVGSMLSFDRFVQAIDEWAGINPSEHVLLQIGDGQYQPRHAEWVRMMPHNTYVAKLQACRLFVAHVGMGSILQALAAQKQALLLPRISRLGEHTTDHQFETSARFRDVAGLRIVETVEALKASMSELLRSPLSTAGISEFAPSTFTDKIRLSLLSAL